MNDDIDLITEDVELEGMPDGNALGCIFSASSASTASCPGSTAASLGSASTLG